MHAIQTLVFASISMLLITVPVRAEGGGDAPRRVLLCADVAMGLDCTNVFDSPPSASDARHRMHEPYLAMLLKSFNDSVIRGQVIPGKRIEVHCTWAGICAEATSVGRHRSEGVGCSSIWETLDSLDPHDTWQRMEAMLEPVLAKLDHSSSNS